VHMEPQGATEQERKLFFSVNITNNVNGDGVATWDRWTIGTVLLMAMQVCYWMWRLQQWMWEWSWPEAVDEAAPEPVPEDHEQEEEGDWPSVAKLWRVLPALVDMGNVVSAALVVVQAGMTKVRPMKRP
jgi:hypothetical protein